MDSIFFGLKRAHQGTLRFARLALAPFGLTPARFDLLYALHTVPVRGMLQSLLRRVLGVTAPTVSRMLRSLEGLGLLVRRRSHPGARQRWVQLTEQGIGAVRRALYLLVSSGAAALAVDCALSDRYW